MSSVTRCTTVVLVGAMCAIGAYASTLRICADPNNLPYSNKQQQGFENQIAKLIARDMKMQITYYWYPQREKFFTKTLDKGVCDVVMGVPLGMKDLDVTPPYYRSSYVFITRRESHLHFTSLDDPELREVKIGVHIFGDQNDAPPPVNALIQRGMVRNLVGFSIFGHLDEIDPSADLIRAVADRKVDVAIAWGPLAGYFSRRSSVPLEITPLPDDSSNAGLPFHFDIGIGVREADSALEKKLSAELVHLRPRIERILRSYGIPQMSLRAVAANSMED